MVDCTTTMSDEESSLSSTCSPPQAENFLSSTSPPQSENLNTDNISEAVNAVLKGQYIFLIFNLEISLQIASYMMDPWC